MKSISKELSVLLSRLDGLWKFNSDVKQKKIQPTRIKYKGKFITLTNGKTIWKRPGDAKNALRNEIAKHAYYDEREGSYEELMESGLIEFVPVTVEGLDV